MEKEYTGKQNHSKIIKVERITDQLTDQQLISSPRNNLRQCFT